MISKDGIAFPLIVLGLLIVIPLFMALYSMNREYSGQVAHVDEVIRCRAIAASVFNTVQARIRENPYSKRFFAPQPFSENRNDFLGGEYELFIIDTPQKTMQADIYVLVTFRRVSRLYFWRILIETTILDAIGRLYPVIFTTLDPKVHGNGSPNSSANSFINQILEDRKRNRKTASDKAVQIKPKGTLSPIIDILQVPDPAPANNDLDPAAGTIGNIPALPMPPKIPVSSVIFHEDFEGLTVGQFPPGWDYIYNLGTGNVSSERAAGGKNSIKFTSGTTETIQGKISINVGTPPPDHLIFEADVYVSSPKTSGGMGFMPVSNNGIFFRGDDQTISFVEAPGQFRSLQPLQAGKWIRVRMDMNSVDRKTDVYADEQLIGAGLPYSSSVPDNFFVGTAHTAGGSGNQTVFFDNIEIRGE